MQEAQGQPLHMDTPRTRFNLPMVLASAVAVIGVLSIGTIPGIIMFILGLAGLVYGWLTTPRQYLIYQNALVIVLGRPRTRAIPFEVIDSLETLTLPRETALGVRLMDGKRAIISVTNLDEFRARLEDALAKFKGTRVEPAIVEQAPAPMVAEPPPVAQEAPAPRPSRRRRRGTESPPPPPPAQPPEADQGPQGPAPY